MRLLGARLLSDSQPASVKTATRATASVRVKLRGNAFMRPDLVALRETARVAERGADRLVELRRQLDERQPQFVFNQTHLGQRPLGGNGIRLDEEPAMQRQQPVVVFTRGAYV